jgi:hypothetical protein
VANCNETLLISLGAMVCFHTEVLCFPLIFQSIAYTSVKPSAWYFSGE